MAGFIGSDSTLNSGRAQVAASFAGNSIAAEGHKHTSSQVVGLRAEAQKTAMMKERHIRETVQHQEDKAFKGSIMAAITGKATAHDVAMISALTGSTKINQDTLNKLAEVLFTVDDSGNIQVALAPFQAALLAAQGFAFTPGSTTAANTVS